jgi:hypothetical protein
MRDPSARSPTAARHAPSGVISFVLFGREERYWNCLPTALATHAESYPDLTLRLNHSSDVVAHPFFPFLRALARRTGRIDLVPVARGYEGTEPTLWRMMPLWDRRVDLVLSRDLDSAPTREELRAVRVFRRRSSPPIHGIRSHRLHDTLLLAGLCGFKNPELGFVRREIGAFEHYWAIYRRCGWSGRWGCDQEMLDAVFARHAERILDTRSGGAPPLDVPVVSYPAETYASVRLDDLPEPLLAICDGISRFSGEPHDDTRPALRAIVELDTPFVRALRETLEEFPRAAAHYLGTRAPATTRRFAWLRRVASRVKPC